MLNKLSTSLKKKSIIVAIFLALTLILVGGGVSFSRKDVKAITTTDTTSYVKVGELFDSDSKTFNEDNFNILLKYISGVADATVDSVNEAISSSDVWYTANDMKSYTLDAGTEGATSYVAKTSSQDICVTLGGLDWQVMTYTNYTTTDGSCDDLVLTLWLDNEIQDAWTDRSATEGAYYGYINGGLYSMYAADWASTARGNKYPSNMYGTSYVNAVTLNNGGVYSTNASTVVTATQSTSSAFALFTMPQFGLTDYIVTPRNYASQEVQNLKYLGQFTYNASNEAWGAEYISDDDFYDARDNYAGKTYNDAWADSYLWLPSLGEVGATNVRSYNGVYGQSGRWVPSTTQRQGYLASANENTIVGSLGGYSNNVAAYYMLRTAYSGENSYNCADANTSIEGNQSGIMTKRYAAAIRPALHLNLTAISEALNATPITDGTITASPSSAVYTGTAHTPTITVTLDGTTLTQGTDYTLSYTLNGTTVSEILEEGEYIITATGKGSYSDTLVTTYTVLANIPSNHNLYIHAYHPYRNTSYNTHTVFYRCADDGCTYIYTQQQTCTLSGGGLTGTCTYCMAYKEVVEVDDGEHLVCDALGTTRSTATCSSGGYVQVQCSVCGLWNNSTTYESALGHNIVTTTTEATCTTAGSVVEECSRCGGESTIISTTDALGHSWNVTTSATCTTTGSRTCTTCGTTESIDALGHNYSSWVWNPEPTCTTTGYKVHTCSRCGGKKTDIVGASHNYSSEVVSATCTTDGTITYTCDDCGYSYTEQFGTAFGHAMDPDNPGWEIIDGIYYYTCATCGELIYTGTSASSVRSDISSTTLPNKVTIVGDTNKHSCTDCEECETLDITTINGTNEITSTDVLLEIESDDSQLQMENTPMEEDNVELSPENVATIEDVQLYYENAQSNAENSQASSEEEISDKEIFWTDTESTYNSISIEAIALFSEDSVTYDNYSIEIIEDYIIENNNRICTSWIRRDDDLLILLE